MCEDRQQKSKSNFELSVTKELKQRKNPFLRPIFTVAAIGGLFMILASILQMKAESDKEAGEAPQVLKILEKMHLTVHGECVCIKSTLNISDQHHRAIRYRGDGNEVKIILLKNNPAFDMDLDYFINGPTPCLVEGDILLTNGLRILQATAFRAYPEK